MLMMQFLKPLSDLSFYFAVFGSLIFFALKIQTNILPLIILAIAQLVCFLLRDKKQKYLPLLLLLLLVPFVTSTADIGIYLLAVYYVDRKSVV